MIEHVVHRLRPAVDEVWVVTSRELELPPLDARIVEDREPARGPLAGIREGLEAADADFAFVTSTDAPFLTPAYVTGMLDRAAPVAPLANGHVQVLSAVYPGSAWKEADLLLSRGVGRPLALLEHLGFEAIPWPLDSSEASPGESDWMAPWQGFNTPDEYLSLARATRPDAVAQVELLGRAALAVAPADARFKVPIDTLGAVLERLPLPEGLRLVEAGRVAKSYLVSLGGRDLVRRLDVPIGPGERVSVLDALAGG